MPLKVTLFVDLISAHLKWVHQEILLQNVESKYVLLLDIEMKNDTLCVNFEM